MRIPFKLVLRFEFYGTVTVFVASVCLFFFSVFFTPSCFPPLVDKEVAVNLAKREVTYRIRYKYFLGIQKIQNT